MAAGSNSKGFLASALGESIQPNGTSLPVHEWLTMSQHGPGEYYPDLPWTHACSFFCTFAAFETFDMSGLRTYIDRLAQKDKGPL